MTKYALATILGLGLVSRAFADLSTLTVVPPKPSGKRGDTATFKVLYKLDDVPGKGVKIEFTESIGNKVAKLGSDTTDRKGEASIKYKIPKDANADNITLTATYTPPKGIGILPSPAAVSVRVGIGKK